MPQKLLRIPMSWLARLAAIRFLSAAAAPRDTCLFRRGPPARPLPPKGADELRAKSGRSVNAVVSGIFSSRSFTTLSLQPHFIRAFRTWVMTSNFSLNLLIYVSNCNVSYFLFCLDLCADIWLRIFCFSSLVKFLEVLSFSCRAMIFFSDSKWYVVISVNLRPRFLVPFEVWEFAVISFGSSSDAFDLRLEAAPL